MQKKTIFFNEQIIKNRSNNSYPVRGVSEFPTKDVLCFLLKALPLPFQSPILESFISLQTQLRVFCSFSASCSCCDLLPFLLTPAASLTQLLHTGVLLGWGLVCGSSSGSATIIIWGTNTGLPLVVMSLSVIIDTREHPLKGWRRVGLCKLNACIQILDPFLAWWVTT